MLYIVPTPLGNLEDITLRALRVLKECDLVLCEDTRRTRQLLTHFDIHVATDRYQDGDPKQTERLLEKLSHGKNLALVSDAGTPLISDPGYSLVSAARKAGHPITSLPGPSAVAAAAAGSGLPCDSFVFLGFLPRTAGKQMKRLAEAAALGHTLVIYESPYRVAALMEIIQETLGDTCRVVICRELSKVHEEWLSGSPSQVLAALKAKKEILGEFVVLVSPS